jgi:hypothetical protein
MIGPDARYVDIVVSVVVVIADRDTDTVHLDSESCLAGDVSERAIFVVVIEGKKRLRPFVRASSSSSQAECLASRRCRNR